MYLKRVLLIIIKLDVGVRIRQLEWCQQIWNRSIICF